jgi:hypothetical protein
MELSFFIIGRPTFRTPDLIMEIQGLKKIARKLTLTLAP